MIVFPNAKINLGLQILRKRQDGFHDICSVFYPVGWTDVLEVVAGNPANQGLDIQLSGLPIAGDLQTNLCHKAYKVLDRDLGLPPATLCLHKVIPMGAGLGGGSADGAQALVLFNQVFELGLTGEQLENYAAELGSDCPFFIRNRPMIVTGRGEHLNETELSLDGWYAVVVNPGIHIGTAEAYSGVTPNDQVPDLIELLSQPIENWKDQVHNQFEESVFPTYSKLGEIKSTLYEHGAAYASMTGSGSTIYGLFKEPIDGSALWPDYDCWEGWLN